MTPIPRSSSHPGLRDKPPMSAFTSAKPLNTLYIPVVTSEPLSHREQKILSAYEAAIETEENSICWCFKQLSDWFFSAQAPTPPHQDNLSLSTEPRAIGSILPLLLKVDTVCSQRRVSFSLLPPPVRAEASECIEGNSRSTIRRRNSSPIIMTDHSSCGIYLPYV